MINSVLLQQWIEHPEMLNRDTLYELRTCLAVYPFFQSLWLLYLKNLYLLHDPSFSEELRRAALYVADRKALFYLIEGERYRIRQRPLPIVATEDTLPEESVDRTLSLIDAYLSEVPDEQPAASGLSYTADYTAFLLQENESSEEEEAIPLLKGHELIEGFLRQAHPEAHELPSVPAAVSTEPSQATASAMDESSSHLLPQVPPVTAPLESNECSSISDESPSDVETFEEDSPSPSFEADEVEKSCFTETLAKIYIKQHRYEKALEIIKKLSLNYPKKNAYFADQIRFLEKLIINAKTKE